MSQLRALSGTVLAAVLLLASTVAFPAAPAHAAVCSGSSGVTVVVDFNQIGGGVQTACDSDGGGKLASDIFPDSGFALRYATRQPGFVCRVANLPTSDPCVNTSPGSAFWSLWVSSGSGWTFANLGATSLRVPDGGMVAFSWDESAGDAPPSISGTRSSAPAPSPTTSPGRSGNGKGGGSDDGSGSTTPGPTGSPSPSASAAPNEAPDAATEGRGGKRKAADSGQREPRADNVKKARKRDSAAPSGSATPEPQSAAPSDDETTPTAVEPPADAGGLPGWVAPALIVLLFGVAGGVMVLRRRSSSP